MIDLKALLKELAALPVFSDTTFSVRRGVKLDVVQSRSSRYDRGAAGRAFGRQRRLRIVFNSKTPDYAIAEVFLHELVHLALPEGESHGFRFRATLARAAREAWGVEVDAHPPPEYGGRVLYVDGVPTSGQYVTKISAYVLDDLIRAKLIERIHRDEVNFFPQLTVAPKPPRSTAMAALVEKRAAHAARMLARAERRLKLAKTIERKWRQKVTRYERIAAKKVEP